MLEATSLALFATVPIASLIGVFAVSTTFEAISPALEIAPLARFIPPSIPDGARTVARASLIVLATSGLSLATCVIAFMNP